MKIKEKIIDEKNRQIDTNSGVLINKYAELADFNRNHQLYKLLKDTVQDTYILQSSQIYKYTVNCLDKRCIVKVEYLIGYVKERRMSSIGYFCSAVK